MILYLLPIALGGCSSLMHQANPPTTQTSANGAAIPTQSQDSSLGTAAHGKKPTAGGQSAARTGTAFSDKLTPEQRYNAHLELGRFQESQENFDLALGEYLKAVEASESRPMLLTGAKNPPRQALAHRRMASALDRMGRFEQAENEYSTALKLSPNDPKIWNDAGYSFYMQGRWADSERALKTATQLDPNNTKYMTNLGLMLAASGKTDEALALFTKAGGQAAGHANLAYVLATTGKTAEAEKHYKIALEFQPQLEPVRTALTALTAKSAYEAKIAAASRPPTEAAPLLIGQPGVLPTAALQQPPPAATPLVPRPPATTAPMAALRQPPACRNHRDAATTGDNGPRGGASAAIPYRNHPGAAATGANGPRGGAPATARCRSHRLPRSAGHRQPRPLCGPVSPPRSPQRPSDNRPQPHPRGWRKHRGQHGLHRRYSPAQTVR